MYGIDAGDRRIVGYTVVAPGLGGLGDLLGVEQTLGEMTTSGSDTLAKVKTAAPYVGGVAAGALGLWLLFGGR